MTEWLSLPPIEVPTGPRDHTLIFSPTCILYNYNPETVLPKTESEMTNLHHHFDVILDHIRIIEEDHEFGGDPASTAPRPIPDFVIEAFRYFVQARLTSLLDRGNKHINLIVPTCTPICTVSFLLEVLTICGYQPRFTLRSC